MIRIWQYGTVKDIRMATDEKGQPKGFAFVEYENEVCFIHLHELPTSPKLYPQQKEAMASLAANNYELKKRRIAVTLADTRGKSSKGRYVASRPRAQLCDMPNKPSPAVSALRGRLK